MPSAVTCGHLDPAGEVCWLMSFDIVAYVVYN
jgi:hypothetical protein